MDIGSFDVLESILGHIKLLKLGIPRRALIGLGRYTNNILIKSSFFKLFDDILFLLIGREGEYFNFAGKMDFIFIDVGSELDKHFWFNLYDDIDNLGRIDSNLKNNFVHKVKFGLMVCSIWDGIGGGLFPYVASKLKKWNVEMISIALIPCETQPSDAFFNSQSSLTFFINKVFSPLIIIDRGLLERYIGVDRNGNLIKGSMILNEVLDLMLSKEDFIDNFVRFSKNLDIKFYTIMISTGCSINIYDSLENIFNSMLYRMLLNFDLNESSIFYVLARIPVKLKDEITKEKVESTFMRWIRQRSNPIVVCISDPILVDDLNDRIDIMVIVGGFNEKKIMGLLEGKAQVTKQLLYKKDLFDDGKMYEIFDALNMI